MKMKKICAGIAAAVMAVSCMSMSAFANEVDYSYHASANENQNGHPVDAALLLFPAIAAAAGVSAGVIINKKRS